LAGEKAKDDAGQGPANDVLDGGHLMVQRAFHDGPECDYVGEVGEEEEQSARKRLGEPTVEEVGEVGGQPGQFAAEDAGFN
jgi:hypothetical protein